MEILDEGGEGLGVSIGGEFASQLSACCCFCPGFWFLMWRRSDGFLSGGGVSATGGHQANCNRALFVFKSFIWLVFFVAPDDDFFFIFFLLLCTRHEETCILIPFSYVCSALFSHISAIVVLECARLFLNSHIRVTKMQNKSSATRGWNLEPAQTHSGLVDLAWY